jgi:hypothetical protein
VRSVFSALLVVCALAACSSQPESTTCSATANGQECSKDTECCSGYCMLEGMGSYCQDKPRTTPACVTAAGYCTQDRNCCDGLCKDNACFGTVLPPGSCLEVGSQCAQPVDCCSLNCQPGQDGTPVCVASDRPTDGGACQPGGATCNGPGDCCTNVCVANVCAGSGGGGPTCGGAGAYCRYGADCCSQQCIKVSNGTQCN